MDVTSEKWQLLSLTANAFYVRHDCTEHGWVTGSVYGGPYRCGKCSEVIPDKIRFIAKMRRLAHGTIGL